MAFRYRKRGVISGGGPVGTGFPSPPVASPDLWLRQDLELFADLAKTTPITTGADIAAWGDISGNGVDFTQSTALNRPTYTAAHVNGLDAPDFDLNDPNWMIAGSSAQLNYDTAQARTIFIVEDFGSALTANRTLVGKFDTGLVRGWHLLRSFSALRYQFAIHNTGALLIHVENSTTVIPDTTNSCIVTYSGNGLASGFTWYINGGGAEGNTTLTDNIAGNTSLTSTPPEICALDSGTTNFWDGAVADLMVWPRVITAGEITTLQAYSTGRYGV